MNSESIVVVILIAIAVGFIIWIRRNSHDHDPVDQTGNSGDDGGAAASAGEQQQDGQGRRAPDLRNRQ